MARALAGEKVENDGLEVREEVHEYGGPDDPAEIAGSRADYVCGGLADESSDRYAHSYQALLTN